MLEYYSYLWITTWPNLIGLILIWGLVLTRLGWKYIVTWRYAHDAWGFLLLAGKTYDAGLKCYVLNVRTGAAVNLFYVDQNVYEQLKIEDQVKLMYLPKRREVVRCELVQSLL